MDEEYDVIVLGTGLTECILSGMMSTSGKKVLHMDRNKYYGGESASMTPIEDFFEKMGQAPSDVSKFGKGRDWNIDLIPKFLMADGKLVSLLIQTGVTRYLEFKICEGSYVFKGGKVHKVPANDKEGIGFSLMGLFEKRRFMKVMSFANEWEADNPKTHGKFTLSTTAQQVYDEFGVDGNTQDIIGHALALYTNDDYKTRQYPELMKRLKLYAGSVSRHGQSPFLYPLYGLAELPQAFARLSAIYGGTYMLDKPTDEIVFEDGKVVGVKSQGEVAKCKQVICDPTYAMDRCKKVGQVVRAYCIMKHMVKDTKAGSTSCQIIIPQHQVNRNSDIYILVVSDNHKVAAKGFYYGIVSTTVETNNPEAELKVGIDLLGELEYKHIVVSDVYEPTDDGSESGVFISKSYDATTHFESTCDNVVDMFSRAFGGDYVPPKERQEGED